MGKNPYPGSRIRYEHPRSVFRDLRNRFLVLVDPESWIRDGKILYPGFVDIPYIPDPQHCLQGSILSLQVSIVSIASPPRLCFEPLQLRIFYLNADPVLDLDPAFHSKADLRFRIQLPKKMRIWIRNPVLGMVSFLFFWGLTITH
jgi:hypothetical protein